MGAHKIIIIVIITRKHSLTLCTLICTGNLCFTLCNPGAFRFVSATELLSLQHLPCVSNLSWSTSQHRAWAKEAGLAMPDHQALSRVSLLLIGCLKAGPGGEWKLMDASGGVSCQVKRKAVLAYTCANVLILDLCCSSSSDQQME